MVRYIGEKCELYRRSIKSVLADELDRCRLEYVNIATVTKSTTTNSGKQAVWKNRGIQQCTGRYGHKSFSFDDAHLFVMRHRSSGRWRNTNAWIVLYCIGCSSLAVHPISNHWLYNVTQYSAEVTELTRGLSLRAKLKHI